MMDHCYVFARGTHQVEIGIKTRLSDDLTSFFKADGAENITNIRTGGKLGQRIAKSLQKSSNGEVLILSAIRQTGWLQFDQCDRTARTTALAQACAPFR